MPKKNGSEWDLRNEIARISRSLSGNKQPNGTPATGCISPTGVRISIRNDGEMNRGSEHFPSVEMGKARVKPEYLRFVRGKDTGKIPASMTWKEYQKPKAGAA